MVDAFDDLFPQGNRLQILSPEEYDLLWGLPQFGRSDRQLFFALTPREQAVVERLRTPRTKLHFLLHRGYFKARQRLGPVPRKSLCLVDLTGGRQRSGLLQQRYLVRTPRHACTASSSGIYRDVAACNTAGLATH